MSQAAWQRQTAPGWQQTGWQAPGQQPGWEHALPAWSSPTHPGPKTDSLAVWAILASTLGTWFAVGLGSIAGIVLGSIALGRIRRSGEDGRLLAVWAIVLGALTIVALIAAVVLGVSFAAQLVELLPDQQ